MFKNIGDKIRTLAETISCFGITLSVLSGLFMMIVLNNLGGLIIIILGSLFSWISSFALYGFGEIIVQLQQLNANQKILQNLLYNINQNTKTNNVQNTNTTAQ